MYRDMHAIFLTPWRHEARGNSHTQKRPPRNRTVSADHARIPPVTDILRVNRFVTISHVVSFLPVILMKATPVQPTGR
jgi:hypothetical protein